jgi:hypothetical protein
MSTRGDSSFEELSYEYETGDEYSSEEFVNEMDDISEGSSVVVLELPVSFLQLNDSDPPAEIASLSAVGKEGDSRRALTHESFSIGGCSSYQMSTPEATMDSSAIADFDILSVGGSSQRQCQRCSFIGDAKDCFCQCCELAWCANPSRHVDGMIAAQMQFKEEEHFHVMIQKEESMRKSLRDQPAPVQAQILTTDILRFVNGCSVRSDDNSLTLQSISEHQLYKLAMEFIADFVSRRDANDISCSKILLYYYVSSNEELTRIRRGGVYFPPVTLYKSLGRADEDISNVGWVVAISYHERINLTTVDNQRKIDDPCLWTTPNQSVLPLAYFNRSEHRDGADRIFKGLELVCFDFFDHFRRIDLPHDGNVRHDGLMQSVDPLPDCNVRHDDLKQSDDPPGCYVRHDGLMERVEL